MNSGVYFCLQLPSRGSTDLRALVIMATSFVALVGAHSGIDSLRQIVNDALRTHLFLKSRRDSVCLDTWDHLAGRSLNVLLLLWCPH